MFFRLVESLLIHIFNSGQRRRAEKRKAKPVVKVPLAPSPEHVVIGHVINEKQKPLDVIARDLLERGVIALTPKARRRHLYVLGATGTGKTNLLLRLIESDIQNKRAFCVIDLRGDLVDRILLRIAHHAEQNKSSEKGKQAAANEWAKRLLLLDLRHGEAVVGFNPLQGVAHSKQSGKATKSGGTSDSGDAYSRAMQMLEVLRSQSDSWGVQLEETLRNSLVALSETGWSLLEIEPLLTNAAFRAEVLSQISDSHVQGFFERFEKLSEANKLAWTMAVLNKVTPLLAIPQLRLMFGQRQGFSFRELLDNEPGMVILVSLAIDKLHHAAHLVGGLLVSNFQTAMMARVDQVESERVPVFLYADEFEMMATERFQEIVAEGRRFGVGLCLSHQNLSQLSVGLRNVLRNNVHTQIYFQTGAVDASELAKEISGDTPKDEVRQTLMSQDVGEAYLIRRAQPSLRMKTLYSPDPIVDANVVAELCRASRAHYASPQSAIEVELKAREERLKGLENKPKASTAPVYEIRHAKTATFKPMNPSAKDEAATNDEAATKPPRGDSANKPPKKPKARKPPSGDGSRSESGGADDE